MGHDQGSESIGILKRKLYIMDREEVIAEFQNGVVSIRRLPLGLYLEEGTESDVLVNNIINFYSWCSRRVLSLDRVHAKAILNSCGLAQAVTDRERAEIALQYKCLSLSDNYWVTDDCSVRWRDIDLFSHSLNEAVPVSLRGKQLTLNNISLIAQDTSTNGLAPKAWIRKEDHIYLMKGNVGNDSVGREVEASGILRALGFNAMEYRREQYEGETVSVCKCYTSEYMSHIALDEYLSCNEYNSSWNERVIDIILASYLVGDSDRHCGNVNILFVDDKVIDIAPMIDFNHAFEASETTRSNISLLVWGISETLAEAVKRLVSMERLLRLKSKVSALSDAYEHKDYVALRVDALLDS